MCVNSVIIYFHFNLCDYVYRYSKKYRIIILLNLLYTTNAEFREQLD